MDKLHINIDGRECEAINGQSILEAARGAGIEIPTLCHDERVKTYGACGICAVEAAGVPRLLRACSTAVTDGMVIKTDTPRVISSRKLALEFLLSDHTGDCRPPCVLACPARTDCQGYVGLIANGEYHAALKLIKDKIPLPASIGRVCPHPCEEACRRQMVEEPIGIAHLKRFAADADIDTGDMYTPDIAEDTGKRVAIAGGGPGGLSAAYFLRQRGHRVTVFDAMPHMGGMLRYGIPEYRLPKAALDEEIENIRQMGVEFKNNIRIGADMTFEELRGQFDAVIIAIGAWTSVKLNCPGEDLPGVLGGIDFLRSVAIGGAPDFTGKRVAVVGGGNTAMDACRTSVRLGAERVYNIYRRTKAEMPAEEIELEEAEEEGVEFKYLVNPIEIVGSLSGGVSGMRLQKMELGAPDSSGRRSPVPLPGEEEALEADAVIIAIGQGVLPGGFEGVSLSRRRTVLADENTFRTNIPGVFAIGDATNKGASIAVEAIGEAERAAAVIDRFLRGEDVPYKEPYLVTREVTADMLSDRAKISRRQMPCRPAVERRANFQEVNRGYSYEQAREEAARCLECGCQDFFECKLIKYTNDYDVKPDRFAGGTHSRPADKSNPFIHRNPDKCILCGLCVRVCDEVMGRTALGLVDRGFDTAVKPELGLPLAETDCITCGQCVTLCPTGALYENIRGAKPIPCGEDVTRSVCSYCGFGCGVKLTSTGGALLRSLPDDTSDPQALLCSKGRFGPDEFRTRPRLAAKDLPELRERAGEITRRALEVIGRHGAESFAVAVSDRLTNEEIFLIKRYANTVLGTDNVFCADIAESGLADVLGSDRSTNTFDELARTDAIVLIANDIVNSHTIAGVRIKQAVENGARLILISDAATQANEWAAVRIAPDNSLDCLKQMVKRACASADGAMADGLDELRKALGDGCPDADAAMDIIDKAKNVMFVYNQGTLTADAERLVADLAVLSGHIGRARNGVIALKRNNNTQGALDMGVLPGRDALEPMIAAGAVKGVISFGENLAFDTSGLEFLAALDVTETELTKKAELVLPLAAPFESCGTYTSSARKVQRVNRAVEPPLGAGNTEIIGMLANAGGAANAYDDEKAARRAISEQNPAYRGLCELPDSGSYAPMGQSPVLYENGFATENGRARLKAPAGDKLFRDTANTNQIYSGFMEYMQENGLIRN